MSTASALGKESIRRLVVPLSVEHYHRLLESGLIPEKTELIEGIILGKMTKSPRHAYLLNRLHALLAARLPAGCIVRKEDPLTLTGSEPEPDLAVVRGRWEDFRERHPTTALLVVEVAVSSLELDREKATIYAGAGIPDYWIVLPAEGRVEVYRTPRDGAYRVVTCHDRTETLAVLESTLSLKELFD